MNRNLDGIYFRVKRDGEPVNICFSDMTLEEIEAKFANQPAEWWKRVALHLKERLNAIGEQFDIINDYIDCHTDEPEKELEKTFPTEPPFNCIGEEMI